MPSKESCKGAKPGQKWTVVAAVTTSKIKDYLLQEGGVDANKITAAAEAWHGSFLDATIKYYPYQSGRLYSMTGP